MADFQGTKMNPARFHKSQIKFYFVLIPLAVFMAFPILYIFTTAFKPMEELFTFPPRFLVYRPTLDNFKWLFGHMASTGIPMPRYLFNSILITLATVVGSVLMCVFSAYVLSKKKFKLRKVIFEINTLALMFVPIAVDIPRFIVIVRLGLFDQFVINILPLLAMPMGLFLVKQFVDQIPDSLIEAAKMDGAGDLVILRRIIIPMSKPALATTAILSFKAAWDTVDPSRFYINDETIKSFAYYMTSFTSSTNAVSGQGISAASTLIMFLPNLIVFLIVQSKVMDTMAHSGIK